MINYINRQVLTNKCFQWRLRFKFVSEDNDIIDLCSGKTPSVDFWSMFKFLLTWYMHKHIFQPTALMRLRVILQLKLIVLYYLVRSPTCFFVHVRYDTNSYQHDKRCTFSCNLLRLKTIKHNLIRLQRILTFEN